MSLTDAQIADYARSVGFSGTKLTQMVAIIFGESGGDPGAVGDTTITTSRWGPSIGLAQIRCLWADRGTGRARDCDALDDPAHNLRAAYEISGGGSNFRPWSVWTSGAWRRHLGRATRAVSGSDGGSIPTGAEGGGPQGLQGGLVGPGEIVETVVEPVVSGLGRVALIAVGLAGGAAMLAAGGWRAVKPYTVLGSS